MKKLKKRTISKELNGRMITIKNAKDTGIGPEGLMFEGTIVCDGVKLCKVYGHGDGSCPTIIAANSAASSMINELEIVCHNLQIFDGFAGFCIHLTAALLDSMDE